MNHKIYFGTIIFFTLFSTIIALLHVYLWRRMVRNPNWSKPIKKTSTTLIWILGCSIPVALLVGRLLLGGQKTVLSIVAYIWLGILFYLVVIQLSWDLLGLPYRWIGTRKARKIHTKGDSDDSNDTAQALLRESRRAFIGKATTGAALLATGGITFWGIKSVFGEIKVNSIAVKLSRLPPQLSGFRIAMLTDLHIGPILDRHFVEEVVRVTNAQRPDMIVITGDLIDGKVDIIGSEVTSLSRLKAKYGVYFVTGNHEYYSGVTGWMSWLKNLDITILMNQMVSIGDKAKDGASFDLLGVEDYRASRFHKVGSNMRSATQERDTERELIVLAHQPVQIHQAAEVGAGLQLSGHTHGGQIFPFHGLVRIAQPYIYGLHQHNPNTQIYVSSGTGFWGPPMRVAAPAEIAMLTLI